MKEREWQRGERGNRIWYVYNSEIYIWLRHNDGTAVALETDSTITEWSFQ